jgi:magnesium transporter
MNDHSEQPPIDIQALEQARERKLAASVRRRAPMDAVKVLIKEPDEVVARVLSQIPPALALKILQRLPDGRLEAVVPEVSSGLSERWELNQSYPEDSVGRLMEPAVAVFGMGTSVRGAVERIRALAREDTLITYAYVTDEEGRLRGVVVMRDLLLAEPEDLLLDVMITEPFYFLPEAPVADAMKAVVHRHYPVYPVCDDSERLIGLVQGYALFEEHAFEISAQPGRMVGVEKEEHISTPWLDSLKMRHPWLQINLLTAFLAAFVVGIFEDTIAQVVALAVFLPVLAGQSGNTGSQALAITLRAMTLGQLRAAQHRAVLVKESLLGLANGALVGLTAGGGMYAYALLTGSPGPFRLALVVFLAMIGSCLASGLSGVLVPLTLKRFGADPATASSIFLTTATDVASMGLFLGLATVLVL